MLTVVNLALCLAEIRFYFNVHSYYMQFRVNDKNFMYNAAITFVEAAQTHIALVE